MIMRSIYDNVLISLLILGGQARGHVIDHEA